LHEEDGDNSLKQTNFYDHFIISQNNSLLFVWSWLYLLCCLTSAYVYGFLAAFFDGNSDGTLYSLQIIYESIFSVNIVLRFFTEYTPEGSPNPERDLSKIASRYLRNEFFLEFITVIPFQLLPFGGFERLFFLIKIFRLLIGFKVFNVSQIMLKIQTILRERIQKRIEKDPKFAEDHDTDHNNIILLIKIGSSLRILLLIIIIVTISYFLGILWFIYCDLTDQLYNKWGRTDEEIANEPYLRETFINQYELDGNSSTRNMLIVVYYMFTSLTTVGFGDFHPKSNLERIAVSFILVFGVATFSYMMGIFISILEKF
jgi:hypothetical protein